MKKGTAERDSVPSRNLVTSRTSLGVDRAVCPLFQQSHLACAHLSPTRLRVYHREMKSLLVLASAAVLSLVSVHAQGLPEGPGKSVFENTCGGCHGADIV